MIRYLAPPPRRPAGLVAQVFDQMRREFGVLAEALTLHHPIPELLAVTWSCLRETVLARGRLPRPVKEAMALAISRANDCPYCIDAHGMMLQALGEGSEERRLRTGKAPEDGRLAAVTAWAAATGRAEASELEAPPFARDEWPEAVATVCCFQYINRLATVLLGDSPLPAPLKWLSGPAVWLAGRTLADTARRVPQPGEGLALVPESLSRDPGRWEHLGWADGSPVLAAAFATFAEVTDRAAAPVLEAREQETVRRALTAWSGEEPPLGRDWLEEPLGGLETDRKPAVRLALLLARAPHRVTADDVAAFRRRHAGDPALLGLLCWSAHETAKRMTRWLEPPTSADGTLGGAGPVDSLARVQ